MDLDQDYGASRNGYQHLSNIRRAPVIITNNDIVDEDNIDVRIKREIDEEIDQNFGLADGRIAPRRRERRRNEDRRKWHYVNSLDITITIGDLLETTLMDDIRYRCNFLHVTDIYKAQDNYTTLIRGIPCTRTRNAGSILDCYRNEIIEIWEVDSNDDRDRPIQSQVEITEEDIIRKRKLRMTNAIWPRFACDKKNYGDDKTRTELEGFLVCRWKMITEYRDAAARKRLKACACTLYHLHQKDIENALFRVPDEHKMNEWRGSKTRGGSYNPNQQDHGSIDVEKDDDELLVLGEGQKYTMGDIFCGAGGASSGARAAGAHVAFGVDSDAAACTSYRTNFPSARLLEQNVSDTVAHLARHSMRFDILHLSPPCQFWSVAHTVAGQHDEANKAILLSACEIINKFRPRIATVEQTYGILAMKHREHFNLLINCFTTHNYTVTWRYVTLDKWGVPQPRKRLIIIASCPGEVHPDFPADLTTKPSVNRALASIPRHGASHHNPRLLLGRADFPKAPWDGNGLARHSLMTSVGNSVNYHPSGLRPLTVRELAAIQTFPADHYFVPGSTEAKKQIGNAFPPAAVKHVYAHLLRHLLKVDKAVVVVDVVAEEEEEEEGGGDNDDDDVVFVRAAKRRRTRRS